METISKVITATSKTIWGEQKTTANETAGDEPVSGLQGEGTATDPYDQGNAENPAEPTGKSDVNNPTSASGPEPTSKTQTPMNPSGSTTDEDFKLLEPTNDTGVVSPSTQKCHPKGRDVIPPAHSNNQGATQAEDGAPVQKKHGADKPKDAQASEGTGTVKHMKDGVEDDMKERDPNDYPVEPMRMQDGSEKIPETRAERRDSKASIHDSQKHSKPPKDTSEVCKKSTSLHADGGATRSSASNEADSLLEENGIHKDAECATDQPLSRPTSREKKEKVSKVEKLKHKLHIGHKKE